jgi:hypothetical protein
MTLFLSHLLHPKRSYGKMTRYFYVLPPELADLRGKPEIEKAVEQAWFHRKSGNVGTDLTDDFNVTLDGCLCNFSVNAKRTGMLNGEYVVTVSGVVLEMSPERKDRLVEKLKRIEAEMNQRIVSDREKLGNPDLIGGCTH